MGNHYLAVFTFTCLISFLVVLALSFVVSPAKFTVWNVNF